MTKIDKLDAEILDHLQRDGRLSNAKLANRLSLSETPCWRRLKQLEDSQVIEGYQAVLNRRKIGLGVMAFVQLGCSEHDEKTMRDFHQVVMDCDNILSCHNTTGDDDFLLVVVARDLDDYSGFVDSVLRKLPGVTSIRSNISLRDMKSSNRLPVTALGRL